MSLEINDELIVSEIWHWKVEDNLTWTFCAGVLKNNYGLNIQPNTVKKHFINYFKKMSGVIIYSKCPVCGDGELIPRISRYSYFISCSKYPKCTHKVNCKRV